MAKKINLTDDHKAYIVHRLESALNYVRDTNLNEVERHLRGFDSQLNTVAITWDAGSFGITLDIEAYEQYSSSAGFARP